MFTGQAFAHWQLCFARCSLVHSFITFCWKPSQNSLWRFRDNFPLSSKFLWTNCWLLWRGMQPVPRLQTWSPGLLPMGSTSLTGSFCTLQPATPLLDGLYPTEWVLFVSAAICDPRNGISFLPVEVTGFHSWLETLEELLQWFLVLTPLNIIYDFQLPLSELWAKVPAPKRRSKRTG